MFMGDFTVVSDNGPFERWFKDPEGNWRQFTMKWNEDQTALFYLDGELAAVQPLSEAMAKRCQCI